LKNKKLFFTLLKGENNLGFDLTFFQHRNKGGNTALVIHTAKKDLWFRAAQKIYPEVPEFADVHSWDSLFVSQIEFFGPSLPLLVPFTYFSSPCPLPFPPSLLPLPVRLSPLLVPL
jgi:hypothetical protein